MRSLSNTQKDFLVKATKQYHETLDGSVGAAFLEKRLLHQETTRFQLGYVADPLPGHEQYRGMLSIPYIRKGHNGYTVVSIRFRCIDHQPSHADHKYNTVAGDTPRLYNTIALQLSNPIVAICEGELDTISAELAGIPAIGVPGAKAWKPHFNEPLFGYEKVFILSDGDQAGRVFADQLLRELPNAVVLPSAPGEDVNSELVKQGRDYLHKKVYSGK